MSLVAMIKQTRGDTRRYKFVRKNVDGEVIVDGTKTTIAKGNFVLEYEATWAENEG